MKPAAGIFGGIAQMLDFERRLDGAQPLDETRAILPGDRQDAEGRIIRGRNEAEFQTDPRVQQATLAEQVAQAG